MHVAWKNWCTVNQLQSYFSHQFFIWFWHTLLFPQGHIQQPEKALRRVDEFSSWSHTIRFQIDESALSLLVCWGLRFPREPRLTVAQRQTLTPAHGVKCCTQQRPKECPDASIPKSFVLSHHQLLYQVLSKALSLPPGEQAQSPACVSWAGEESGTGERKGVNLRGGLSGGSVGCRFLLQ